MPSAPHDARIRGAAKVVLFNSLRKDIEALTQLSWTDHRVWPTTGIDCHAGRVLGPPMGGCRPCRKSPQYLCFGLTCEFLQCTVLGKHGAVSDDVTPRGRDVIFFLKQAKIISRCRYVPGMPRPGVSK